MTQVHNLFPISFFLFIVVYSLIFYPLSKLVGQVKRSNGLLTGSDRDEALNKYKRRPPWQAFKRMLRYAIIYLFFIKSLIFQNNPYK